MTKTLNDIIPPSRRREFPQAEETHTPHRESFHVPRRRTPWGTIIVALIVVGISAGILVIFSNAEVVVTQKNAAVSVDATLSATRSEGTLAYEVVSVDRTKSETVTAESSETVQVPAQGSITIYNEQATVQTLIKNTRFESPEGLIFRVRDSVKVPAAKAGTPGSTTATVYADEAGTKYNIGATKFTLPGLKGGASYTLVYARSTADMSGGFAGTRPTVSKATADAKRDALRGTLATELSEALLAEVPEGYVLIDGSTRTAYESLPDAAAATGSVEVREKATMRAVVLPAKALASAVAYKTVGQYQNEPISFVDTKDLHMVFGQDEKPWEATYTTLSFALSGNTTLAWDVQSEKIAAAVAGKTRDAAQVILTNGGFPEVGGARIVLRPFWRTVFPEDATKIKVSLSK